MSDDRIRLLEAARLARASGIPFAEFRAGRRAAAGAQAAAAPAPPAPRATTPGQAVLDGLVEAASASLAASPGPLALDEIRSAVRAAASPEDLAARLAVLLPESDPAWAETLARAQFAAAVLGYVNADEGVA